MIKCLIYLQYADQKYILGTNLSCRALGPRTAAGMLQHATPPLIGAHYQLQTSIPMTGRSAHMQPMVWIVSIFGDEVQ